MDKQKIAYENILEEGMKIIKDETDLFFEVDREQIINIAFRISGIVDFLEAIKDAMLRESTSEEDYKE